MGPCQLHKKLGQPRGATKSNTINVGSCEVSRRFENCERLRCGKDCWFAIAIRT